MAVCNLFKNITKSDGTFFMFSQYTEDLTKMATQNELYKVTPSKFIALNLNYENFTNGASTDGKISFPYYLQYKFENGCAYLREYLREKEDIDIEWTPELSANLFWNALAEKDLIKTIEVNGNNYINEVQYVGDINFQSYDEHAGMGYSEIYCYIPNEAKRTYLSGTINKSNTAEGIEYPNKYVRGYGESDEKKLEIDLKVPDQTKYYYTKDICNIDFGVYGNSEDDDSFDINTIIVLYDIYQNDNEPSHSNIPLGLYITGEIDEKNGSVTNSFTKFFNNEDIYNTGTSYGLRICSRFTPTPNNTNIHSIDVNTSTDNTYAAICKTLSEFSKTQEKMNDVVESIYSTHNMFKEQLSIFKNYRTNIPYIKNINDKNYWFVNGQNTGVEAEGGIPTQSYIYKPYDADQINEYILDLENNIGGIKTYKLVLTSDNSLDT